MDWIKRWWRGEQPDQEATPQEQPQPREARARRKEEEPVLRDAEPGELGSRVQGLDWYERKMLQDEDGDVAHEFFEEPQRAKRESVSPEHKRAQPAPLQSSEARLKPPGPSDVLVHDGNVFVVPRDDGS